MQQGQQQLIPERPFVNAVDMMTPDIVIDEDEDEDEED